LAVQPQQFPERSIFHDWITERQVRIDPIAVATSATATTHIPRLLEVAQELVRVALGDIHSLGDLPHPHKRVSRNGK